MQLLRLAYTTQFLIALFTIFDVWSQVGGQSHLDLMPWYLKLGLSGGASFAIVKATAAAVSSEHAWNGQTLRWLGILAALLVGCGLASYYYHLYEQQQDEQDESVTSRLARPAAKTAGAPEASAAQASTANHARPLTPGVTTFVTMAFHVLSDTARLLWPDPSFHTPPETTKTRSFTRKSSTPA